MSASQPAKAPARMVRRTGLQVGNLYKFIRGRREKGLSKFMGEGLALSLALHLVVLLIFAGMRFGALPAPRPEIQIRSEIIENLPIEPPTLKLTPPSAQQGAGGDLAASGEQLAETLQSTEEAVEHMSVDPLNTPGLVSDLLASNKQPVGAGWGHGADLTGRVGRGGSGYGGAMDALAGSIARTLKNHSLLVVILSDGSRSLQEARKLLAAQLQRSFDELKFAIDERQERKLAWAVISYGAGATMALSPTRDTVKVQEALRDLPIEESGQENVLGAIDFCLDKLGRKADRMMVLVLTDEQGDDAGVDSESHNAQRAIERMVAKCDRRNARVYVLGREALFLTGKLLVYLQHEGISRRGYQDIGLATCRAELCPEIDYFQVATNMRRQGAGFGCYTLSALATHTGGTFFIVSQKPSQYDPVALQAYQPEWVYPSEYDRKNHDNRLRRKLDEVRQDMQEGFDYWSFNHRGAESGQPNYWRRHRTNLDRRIDWCERAIAALRECRGDLRKIDRDARKRWQANYELTVAQLFKMKAVMYAHIQAVDSLLQKPPAAPGGPKPEGTVLMWSCWPRRSAGDPGRAVEVKEAGKYKEALADARAAFEIVIAHHPDTPWADTAGHEMRTFPSAFMIRSSWYKASTDRGPPNLGM